MPPIDRMRCGSPHRRKEVGAERRRQDGTDADPSSLEAVHGFHTPGEIQKGYGKPPETEKKNRPECGFRGRAECMGLKPMRRVVGPKKSGPLCDEVRPASQVIEEPVVHTGCKSPMKRD